ncbi:unnamed protein product [Tilletia controversa]|nr:unnamed protein product [Tilletia controversa]CAD6925650.1 unnamed protein product [Tilletia controversa]CAD6949932.1 unnamed protein product [Tilletia controversa]
MPCKSHARSGSKAGPSASAPGASPVLPQRSSSIAASPSSTPPAQEEVNTTALPASYHNLTSLTAKAEAIMSDNNSSSNNGGDLHNSNSNSNSNSNATSTAISSSPSSTSTTSPSAPVIRHVRRPSIPEKSVAVLRALSRSPSQDDDHYFHVAGLTAINNSNGNGNGNGHVVEKVPERVTSPALGAGAGAGGVKPKGRFPTPLITEKPRKVFHSSIGFLVLGLYLSHADIALIVRGLSYFLGIVVTADVIRLNYAPFERVYENTLGFLMRESEKTKVNGVVFYLVGTVAALRLFPEDVACVGIMTLSWADTAASLFGRMFGSFTPPLPSPPFASRKSLAGFIAAALTGAGIAALFWGTDIASTGERAMGLSWLGNLSSAAGGIDPGATFGTAAVGTGWMGFGRGFMPRPRVAGVGAVLAKAAEAASGAAQSASASSSGTLSSWFFGKASSAASGAASGLASASNLVPSSTPLAAGKVVPSMPLWLLSLSTGLVAAVAESLELGGLDDNLTLPLMSAAGITGVLYAWGRVGEWVLNGSGAGLVESVLGR